MKEETIIISLGGSLIFPEEIDSAFLKSFKMLIEEFVSEGKKFVIITGGGKICRKYQDVAKELTSPSDADLDWIGIATTRANAEFVRVIFGDLAYNNVILNPHDIPHTVKPVILGGGWKPGNSSDLASIEAALSVGAKKVINLSNIDYVYDKDPRQYPDAKKIEKISWADLRKILPESWDPGLNAPFDPIAAKKAEEMNIEVATMNGKNLDSLRAYIDGKEFTGTLIS